MRRHDCHELVEATMNLVWFTLNKKDSNYSLDDRGIINPSIKVNCEGRLIPLNAILRSIVNRPADISRREVLYMWNFFIAEKSFDCPEEIGTDWDITWEEDPTVTVEEIRKIIALYMKKTPLLFWELPEWGERHLTYANREGNVRPLYPSYEEMEEEGSSMYYDEEVDMDNLDLYGKKNNP
jgi:hypothetical protein